MRKESKQNRTITTIAAQSYHQYRETRTTENYAASGFSGGFRYFASDRSVDMENVQNPKGYGIEWETVSSLNSQTALMFCISRAAMEMFTSDYVKFQEDGSLRSANSSVEMITNVGTKAYIRNHYTAWKAFYSFMKSIDSLPDDRCGMHINVSIANFGKNYDEQCKNIMKLHNWIADNYELACNLLKRNAERTTYCGPVYRNDLDYGDHYHAMNYSHMEESGNCARVEIRLVGPQKTYASFRNTMEVVFWLVKQSKELSAKDWENPVKLWSGCNQYVMQRLEGFLGSEIENEIRNNVKIEELI